MNTTYKSPEKVACLKKDWAALSPADQAMLLHEFGKTTVGGLLTDWKGTLLTFAKWAAVAVGSFLLGGMLTSCTVTPAQAAQVQGAHNIYHAVSGKPCIIKINSISK